MGKLRVEKVSGATNTADALTKYHGISLTLCADRTESCAVEVASAVLFAWR